MMHRRKIIGIVASILGLAISRPLGAALRTPSDAEGPFYPREEDFLSDRDNYLVVVADAVIKAGGQILHLSGTVIDQDGASLPDAKVEIWQCDVNGRYLHGRDWSLTRSRDPYFQGYGKTKTDEQGKYTFRTIKPIPYPGRTPHIHFKVHDPRNGSILTTQMYVAGEQQNAKDSLYQRLSAKEQKALTVNLHDAGNHTLQADFKIVL